MNNFIIDKNIKSLKQLISPAELVEELPLTEDAINTVKGARNSAERIIQGLDDRLLVIVGPCSIHNSRAALEYASLLKDVTSSLQNELCIIMRSYFEKPRTTVGWKGLINDPNLDGSFEINQGLLKARKLLLDINDMGVPTATEFLDTIIPQFIVDLISWGAIGARTTECQIHRELASGLSVPIGFKNGTSGNIDIAIYAIKAANFTHHFLGVTKSGRAAIVRTKGNNVCHIILRGSKSGTNFDADSVNGVVKELCENSWFSCDSVGTGSLRK